MSRLCAFMVIHIRPTNVILNTYGKAFISKFSMVSKKRVNLKKILNLLMLIVADFQGHHCHQLDPIHCKIVASYDNTISISLQDLSEHDSSIEYQITHYSGHSLYHGYKDVSIFNNTFDLHDVSLPNGMYIFSAITNTGKIISNKFVITK